MSTAAIPSELLLANIVAVVVLAGTTVSAQPTEGSILLRRGAAY